VFTAEVLDRGRTWYRRWLCRELELGEADAIIHARMEERECYVVLEWPDGQLHIRASAANEEEGRALGRAGLYEIEELVAEEASPLQPDRRRLAASNGNGQASFEHARQ